MKKSSVIWFLLLVSLVFSCKDDKRYHDQNDIDTVLANGDAMTEIAEFQKELSASFKDPETSPLADAFRKSFTGLDFFKPDTNLRVIAQLERTPEALPFLMPTTTSRESRERVYGIAYFQIGSREFELELYQNLELLDQEEYENYLFLPFTDKTNGTTTYSGGRYLDLEIPVGDTLIIDFNKAYNPYCTYNAKYSCPIVPAVNHLDMEIRAGVKDYNKKEP